MAKIKYTAKENKKVGTHSFYAVPVPTGQLTFAEMCKFACKNTDIEQTQMVRCVTEYMRAVQDFALLGYRVPVGEQFLTIYPNITVSVKDELNPDGSVKKAATAKMLTASNAKSRLGCTVSAKFSQKFAQEVSWQKVDASGAAVDEEEDITEGNENVEGGSHGAVSDSPSPSAGGDE